MRGDDVAALQQRLTDLGYFSGAVDGVFGYKTESAVRRFQRAKGLVVDGVAGPATQQALATPIPEPTPSPPAAGAAKRAVSLHLGLNSVSPAGYGGWSGQLQGCEADADTMTAIAEAEGFATNQLKSATATADNVLTAISQIAASLTAGDMFLLTYAGHGSQMPNGDSDPETDSQDETWCLYDRQLLDDEIYAALAAFAAGVNIVLLSDSCHSGTIYRMVPAQTSPRELDTERSYAQLKECYYLDLASTRPGPADPPFAEFPVPSQFDGAGAAAQLAVVGTGGSGITTQLRSAPAITLNLGNDGNRSGDGNGAGGPQTRDMPFDTMTRLWPVQAQQYSQIRQAVANRSEVQANGLSISGCMDNQLSQETNGHGVFTTTLNRVWANRGFTASYTAFHKAIVAEMGPTQTPNLGLFGAAPDQLAAATPFNR
ncbi:peptidoglycan-binding protein [Kribbella sp. NBC_00359]|uniref:peptidoglycan-binding protein n=1 Tax=Kribbella sp. NBC_00359 TaxID=2975966 RepID=UPI003FA53CDD